MEKTRLSISQWAEEDRPREKMAAHGAEALSNAELLAILVGSGSSDESAVQLMRRVLKSCNDSLNTLGKKSIDELCKFKGIGPAKAIIVLAACEFGKRRQHEKLERRHVIHCSQDIYDLFLPVMQDFSMEQFWVVFLNQSQKIIKMKRMSVGGITQAVVDVRLLMQDAILCNATLMIVTHNHPSGNILPSSQDDGVTVRIKKVCELMDIKLLDHVIVADGAFL